MFIALCLFSLPGFADEVTFTGGGDGTSWEDAANWDLGVPQNKDDAVIPDGFDVSFSSDDRVQSIMIEGSSSLTLEDAEAEGDVKLVVNGNDESVEFGIMIVEGGSMTVGENALLVLKESEHITITLDMEATFDNYGTVRMNDNEGDHLYLGGGSTFNNYEGATLKSDMAYYESLVISGGGMIEEVSVVEGEGEGYGTTTFNNWGDVIVVAGYGDAVVRITGDAELNNYSFIKLEGYDEDELLLIQNGGIFNNYEAAELKLLDAYYDGIKMESYSYYGIPVIEGEEMIMMETTLNNWGEILVKEADDYSIRIEGMGVVINNYNSIKCVDNDDEDHVRIEDGATFNNMENALLKLVNPYDDGIEVRNELFLVGMVESPEYEIMMSQSVFNNWGEVDIDGDEDDEYGIYVYANTGYSEGFEGEGEPLALFNNWGNVDINKTYNEGLLIEYEFYDYDYDIVAPMVEGMEEMEEEYAPMAAATFQNWGNLTIRNVDDEYGIYNEMGSLINYSDGVITTKNTYYDGLYNYEGFVTNFGAMELSKSEEYGIYNEEGTIVNYGSIDLINNYYDAIYNEGDESENGYFVNFGKIDIFKTEESGIENDEGRFYNYGEISIDKAEDEGIYNYGFFHNDVDATIDVWNGGDIGIYNYTYTCYLGMYAFVNDGMVTIDGTEDEGLYNYNYDGYCGDGIAPPALEGELVEYGYESGFHNNGKLYIRNTPSDEADIYNEGAYFKNGSCGVLHYEGELYNDDGDFANYGYVFMGDAFTNDEDSYFMNEGVLVDAYGVTPPADGEFLDYGETVADATACEASISDEPLPACEGATYSDIIVNPGTFEEYSFYLYEEEGMIGTYDRETNTLTVEQEIEEETMVHVVVYDSVTECETSFYLTLVPNDLAATLTPNPANCDNVIPTFSIEVSGGLGAYSVEADSESFANVQAFGSGLYSVATAETSDATVTVTDEIGCEVVFDLSDESLGLPPVVDGYEVVKESGVGENDGKATVEVSGGVDDCEAGLTYTWTNTAGTVVGDNSNELMDVPSGTYGLVIADCEGQETCVDIYIGRESGRARGRKTAFAIEDMTSIQVAPNPTANLTSIQLSLTETTHISVSVFNTTGQEIYQLHNGELEGDVIHTFSFDASDLPTGMYIVEIMDANANRHHEKIMVAK